MTQNVSQTDSLFRIKVCGVMTVDDAKMVAESGADAIGFNFAEASSRCVSVVRARELAATCDGLVRVGVFVNQPVDDVNRIAEAAELQVIQLHGDESIESCRMIERPVIKALAYGADGAAPLVNFWKRYHAADDSPANCLLGLLIDASVAGYYGGTGATVDWDRLASERSVLDSIPWALAGGLDDDNVAQAIEKLRPWGVDVASGVESAPGQKDARKTQRFVQAARKSFGLGSGSGIS